MARFEIIPLLICLWITSSVSTDSTCPSGESIRPCYCIQEPSGYKTVICNELDNAEELRNVTTHFKSVVIDRFHILGSFNKGRLVTIRRGRYEMRTMVVVPEMLPSHWLNYARILSLDINNSSLSNCFLCNNPLVSQEEFLLSLTVSHSLQNESYIGSRSYNDANDTTLINTWNLRRMKKLMSLDLSYNHIAALYEEAFPSTLKSLERIVLAHNDIEWMENNVFLGLTSLRHLDLSHNKLTNVHTLHFTSLLNSLQLLDVSWNYVSSLEIGSFDNMTELADIRLNHNNIEFLPASSFSGLSKEIVDIHVRGNFIICDCNLSWIVKKNFRIFGSCASPKEVAFRQISTALPTLHNCSASALYN